MESKTQRKDQKKVTLFTSSNFPPDSKFSYLNDDASISKYSHQSGKSASSYKSSFSLSTVPSLIIDVPKPKETLGRFQFASTMPVFSRDKYDLFGVADIEFKRKDYVFYDDKKKDLKETEKKDRFHTVFPPSSMSALDSFDFKLFDDLTNPLEKKPSQTDLTTPKALQSGPAAAGRRQSLLKKGASSSNIDVYSIRNTKHANLMKNDEERKNQLEFAVQRKKDRKEDERYNRRRGSSFAKYSPNSGDKATTPFTNVLPGTADTGEGDENLSYRSNSQNEFDGNNGGGEFGGAEREDYDNIGSIELANDDLKDFYDLYIGDQARLDFQYKYKKAYDDYERYPNDNDLPSEGLTPRSLYLRGTVQHGTLPLQLLIRKENEPLGVYLGHRGVGDLRMEPLIRIIDKLPGVRHIDLSDNRLTDLTLLPLTEKLLFMKNLIHLDLSFNKIDDSSIKIQEFLIHENCILKTLILNGADVDDSECKNIAIAVTKNKSLRTLSLAKNLIGKTELLNILHPELITGGEALGMMLKENKTLTKLDLSWNSIRLDSAIALAESLESNQTLKVLLLAYNSFGDMPSQILGRALKTNKSLIELDLESNSLNPKAATVLANAISFNETLLRLNINGNTLGKIGAQALVAAIQRSSTETRKLQVSFVNCDCNKVDDNIFSAANPHGTWKMNLREPYGQMVAAECLYLANQKAGCRIVKLLYNGQIVSLERAYVARAEEGEAGLQKKFKLEEFYKTSRAAANALLIENYEEASIALNNLLKTFTFSMEDETRMVVLRKTLELWTVKAKREGRDVSLLLYVVCFFLLIFIFFAYFRLRLRFFHF
jgi:Ran GTPase-activating protein (RanGAP) involved in mRNA processing and transport